ncbi:MAG TPA: hypothetical protein VN809_16075 [Telmatospirillum sp.]|nr:hypothetical protein [Telmatospirillum sp.]
MDDLFATPKPPAIQRGQSIVGTSKRADDDFYPTPPDADAGVAVA